MNIHAINKPAAQVTDEEVQALVERLRKDPRVAVVCAETRLHSGHTAIYVKSSELDGTFSYGRVAAAHALTPEQIEIEKCERRICEMRAQQTRREVLFQDLMRREANTTRLNAAGFSVTDVGEAWRIMCSGHFLDSDSRVGMAADWHRVNVSTNYKLPEHYVL